MHLLNHLLCYFKTQQLTTWTSNVVYLRLEKSSIVVRDSLVLDSDQVGLEIIQFNALF